eukprot:3757987-Amphidinium_carterae.1
MMYAHEDASCLLRPMSSVQSPDALLHEMVGSMQFVERVRYRFAFEDHINALEGRAWLTAVKWLASCKECRLVARCSTRTQLVEAFEPDHAASVALDP